MLGEQGLAGRCWGVHEVPHENMWDIALVFVEGW